jgi:hypothetical protein
MRVVVLMVVVVFKISNRVHFLNEKSVGLAEFGDLASVIWGISAKAAVHRRGCSCRVAGSKLNNKGSK